MEVKGCSPIHDTSHSINEMQRHYHDFDGDNGKIKRDATFHYRNISNNATAERMMSSGGSIRSARKEIQSNITSPKKSFAPSLKDQIRRSSSSRKNVQKKDSDIRQSANKCIENSFHPATLSSAKSIAYSLVNPCGLSTANANNEHSLPTTPSTICSSFSDESQTSRGESFETSSTLCSQLDSQLSVHQRRTSMSKTGNGQNSKLLDGRSESRQLDRDIIIFVGHQQFRFLLSTSSSDFLSKYFSRRQMQADHFLYVDLSAHSPEEFKIVMDFFDEDSTTDTPNPITWKNISTILPWLVEFRAMPLLSAVDSFLLHNGLSVFRNRGYNGANDNKNQRVSLYSLLSLTEIAFSCGLESTKLHAQRLLRQSLLLPRKQTDISESDRSRLGEVAEDIELEWTLNDLQILARVLQINDDLREYLWASAVIIYLPHDLDISDSAGLVKNVLFPYLLREGMMQMMIVEGLESSYQTNDNSMLTEISGASSTIISNSKGVGSSFSDHTSCSDTTIPTTPSQRNSITDKDLQHYVQSIIKKLEKFKVEKETNSAISEGQHHSLLVDEMGGVPKTRSRRRHGGVESRSTSTTSTSRGFATFAC